MKCLKPALTGVVLCLFALSCKTKEKIQPTRLSDTLAIIIEKDLIPEGTAYDSRSNRVFISSMHKRKIVAVELDGSYYDFAANAQDSLWCVLGMEVDTVQNKLWVLSSRGVGMPASPDIDNSRAQSRLYCYSLETSRLDKIYEIAPGIAGEFGFNDLTVSSKGDVYITESIGAEVYVLKNGSTHIEKFLRPSGLTFLNGITLSGDEQSFFFSSEEGLFKVDIATKKYEKLNYEFTIKPTAVDGLTFYKNSLVAHQSSTITRFYLTSELDSILLHETIDNRFLNSSTTGEIGENGWYYFIANSQIRSGIDYKAMKVKSLDSLQNTVIRRKKL